VIILGVVRGTSLGPIKDLGDVLSTPYGVTWLVALVAAILTFLWGKIAINGAVRAMNVAPIRADGTATDELEAGHRPRQAGRRDGTAGISGDLHLHDPDAVRPVNGSAGEGSRRSVGDVKQRSIWFCACRSDAKKRADNSTSSRRLHARCHSASAGMVRSQLL